ncbi:acetate/propionate family kinase [Flagellimonas meridianipacifica]|uniref:Acetate kinase n=1 Tax=Flagellimonas meridianipacifica TaxID=1080225 RepID=A0A2T0MAU5_9FLAO|nr:acetate kinase [Allomuricauda pacifica]PRX54618.1 acetate kinase [Allomuricauda pacifica]
MNVLIINAGSSSIKYQVIDMPLERVVCSGMVERIGFKDAILRYETNTVEEKRTLEVQNHETGFQKIVELLLDSELGVIKETKEIEIVGHRVVHGGNSFSDTTLITKEVKEKIKELSVLAPLHNPHNLEGVLLAEKIFSDAKQIAVFDTAFHQSLPLKAKKYALPNEFYTKHGIQVYGFHGTSHKYVSERAVDYLQNKEAKIITLHLGNGCSMTAVQNGQSVDHSLGFTPSNGLIMGSRSGDIDHSIIFYLHEKLGYPLSDIESMLIKKSGMLGLTGHSDLRDIQREAEKGNTDCLLALEMNAYRIKKYIGAYTAALNGFDALVFTAGIGENSSVLRNMVCRDMDYLGLVLNQEKNEEPSSSIREISDVTSKVRVLIVPTNEELEIAKQAFAIVGSS